MNVVTERVYAPHDPDDGSSEGLLAVIVRTSKLQDESLEPGTHFLTDPTLPLQVAMLGHNGGDKIPPHYHPPHERRVVGTPEVLVVVGGSYRMTLTTTRGRDAGSHGIDTGDIVILLSGGHGFTALEDESGMLEVKIGPYLGAADKVRL